MFLCAKRERCSRSALSFSMLVGSLFSWVLIMHVRGGAAGARRPVGGLNLKEGKFFADVY
jgi:hypothetical protein